MTTAGARPDLSHLDAIDLQALRLGAQVMVHKAELAARPRVELFFRGLQLTVDEELARRRRGAEEGALPPPGQVLRTAPFARTSAVSTSWCWQPAQRTW